MANAMVTTSFPCLNLDVFDVVHVVLSFLACPSRYATYLLCVALRIPLTSEPRVVRTAPIVT